MKLFRYFCYILGLGISLFSLPAITSAQTATDPNFNPNSIITDEEMLDASSLTLEDIKKFLRDNGSYLADYYTLNAYGQSQSAAEIIYNASNNNYDCEDADLSDSPTAAERQQKCRQITTINPKALLVLLQKEQSLVGDTAPKQSQLDWATGYGCPDNLACNPYYKGFGKQVNSAALQFLAYIKEPERYKNFQVGKTYIAKNKYYKLVPVEQADSDTLNCPDAIKVTPANQATASLYIYTPHIFNGNYNFYHLWQTYFPVLSYPNGTLLQSRSDGGIWLIENNKKRPFSSKSAFSSRFSESKVIVVDRSVLDSYEKGPAIKFPNYSILRLPDKKLYLIVDDKKRLFANTQAFKHFGFNTEEILDAQPEDLAGYRDGQPLTATSTYAYGALLQDKKTGGVYWVDEGTKAPLIDKVLLQTKFKGKKIIKATEADLAKYKKIDPVLLDNGELLRTKDDTAVFLIDGGQKRPFTSGEIFEKLGYDWKNVITVSPQLLYLYPNGTPITLSAVQVPALTATSTAPQL